jgi:hypothetical protein
MKIWGIEYPDDAVGLYRLRFKLESTHKSVLTTCRCVGFATERELLVRAQDVPGIAPRAEDCPRNRRHQRNTGLKGRSGRKVRRPRGIAVRPEGFSVATISNRFGTRRSPLGLADEVPTEGLEPSTR